MDMIQKILIANRAEIAVRIIRTCKKMGIQTVAVYSTADTNAYHVQLADQAVCIGKPASQFSYLHMNNLIEAACSTGCDAIHPGFGFLSENARFARLVQQCGLIWIGPKPEIIEKLGNKTAAKKTMQQAGIPIIQGSDGSVSMKDGKALADALGYPVIIKAVNGGGGRGMRIVNESPAFETSYAQAQREATACFGNGDLYVEKYIADPKHIEVQIAGDAYGHCVHFFERDCSFQIRNQKMIEEAPYEQLPSATRQDLYEAALRACRMVGYDSIGTVEFLLENPNQFYFIEMNTRIQVEHPITEMITGIDLVELQITLADKKPMPYTQQDIHCYGHAMECRINAEDMQKDLAPSPGKITFCNLPGGRGVRIDSAMYTGYVIPPFYDSMICKLITYGKNRKECIDTMRLALEETIVEGVPTNVWFHYQVLHDNVFLSGTYTTKFATAFLEQCQEK